jgi:hypothetical protein
LIDPSSFVPWSRKIEVLLRPLRIIYLLLYLDVLARVTLGTSTIVQERKAYAITKQIKVYACDDARRGNITRFKQNHATTQEAIRTSLYVPICAVNVQINYLFRVVSRL